jgi:hypothetical protein
MARPLFTWTVAAASELNRIWHKTATWMRWKRQALAAHLTIADWISLLFSPGILGQLLREGWIFSDHEI